MYEPDEWLSKLEDLDLFQCLIYGEARGEPLMGQIGVACVVRNRKNDADVSWWGDTWKDVMLRKQQFCCFDPDDSNLIQIKKTFLFHMSDRVWKQCRWVASGVLYSWLPDFTKGADHYHAINMKKKPEWSDDRFVTVRIENHVFYNL
jgi:N-acetylmuramoyl-L-alanine amidase